MSQVCENSDHEVINIAEEVDDEKPDPPSQSSSIYTLFGEESIGDDDDGEISAEREDNANEPDENKHPAPKAKKPGHQRAEKGVYEELDYSIDPLGDATSHNETSSKKKSFYSKERKTTIISILGIAIIGVVASGIAFALYGK